MRVLTLFRTAFRSPTSTDWATFFEEEYPLSLPGRLEFHEERLGVRRERILRLAGAPPAFAADPTVSSQPWETLVAQLAPEHRDRLAAVEETLADYLAHFGYDCDAAAANLRRYGSAQTDDETLLAALEEGHGKEAFNLLTEFLARAA